MCARVARTCGGRWLKPREAEKKQQVGERERGRRKTEREKERECENERRRGRGVGAATSGCSTRLV